MKCICGKKMKLIAKVEKPAMTLESYQCQHESCRWNTTLAKLK